MRRTGFTVIEMLVAVSITAVLLALVIPAIQSTRDAARRMTCAHNLRQIATGVLVWTESRRQFPPAAVWKETPDHPMWDYRNWVVEILPMLDRADIADRWNQQESLGHPVNQSLASTHIRPLACPSDISALGQGDLSYALNRGVGLWVVSNYLDCDIITDAAARPVDLNGDGRQCAGREFGTRGTDRGIYRQTTFFFDVRTHLIPRVYKEMSAHHSLNDVSDGLSNTLMIGENVRTGYDAKTLNANWASSDAFRTSLFFSSEICRDRSCTADRVDLSRANSGEVAINSGRMKPEGTAPWPNSNHTGGVTAAFADGRVQFLSEAIDGTVYYNLFTPQGGKLAGTPLDGGS